MSDPFLEFSLQNFTAEQLAVKVKNISSAVLDKTLIIELQPPLYLLSKRINEAAVNAPNREKPIGSETLAGIVSAADGWSTWVRRETSDSSAFIVLTNDLNHAGDLITPVKLAAGAEFTVRIPLDPEGDRANIDLLYSYQHGTKTTDPHFNGKLELKTIEKTPLVILETSHPTPTMIKPGDPATIRWSIEDGVSATLRGPLPGGNSELTLSSEPGEPFQMAEGSLDVRVGGPMTYMLQAEVKRSGQPNAQVVKMLSLDTSNNKYTYVDARPDRVLPYGLVEIDWAAWGVKQVSVLVSDHTTRVIPLTQQTLGRFYEGSGVMRVNAIRTPDERITVSAPQLDKANTDVSVVSWKKMTKPDFEGSPLAMAVIAPYLALLTDYGLHIADVGSRDKSPPLEKLAFTRKTSTEGMVQWRALTALDKWFLGLRFKYPPVDFGVEIFTSDGQPSGIPVVSLPPEALPLWGGTGLIFDFVTFGNRAYVVIEAAPRMKLRRLAYSIGINSATKKADLRPEPLLASLAGYRLVTFDDGLYAFSQQSGRMFRFELTKEGTLDKPTKAATAVKQDEENSMQGQSMISRGLIVPVGRVLVALNPAAVPSVPSLEKYGLKNTLHYENTKVEVSDPESIPQDLVYNPQKDYWGRCGQGLQVQKGAIGAFRGGESPRLWVIQPDHEAFTLAVGDETLFAHDYWLDFPTKPLAPYINKKRQFTIRSVATRLMPLADAYIKRGIIEVEPNGPSDVSAMPNNVVEQFSVDVTYNEADPAPVTFRMQVPRVAQSRNNDYIMEVTLSGPNLSTATSCFKRLGVVDSTFVVDEVVGSRVQHATDKIIDVARPARFDEMVEFVLVNACSSPLVHLKLRGIQEGAVPVTDEIRLPVGQNFPDFSAKFEGQIVADNDLWVNFNFAAPHGIEVSSRNVQKSPTKLVRIDTWAPGRAQVLLVKMLMPGDAPLTVKGAKGPIAPSKDHPVYVCQLDYQIR